MVKKQDVIDLLSQDYDEDKITKVIDKLIADRGLNPNKLPNDFADLIVKSFEVAEESKTALPPNNLTIAQSNFSMMENAQEMGIPADMMQIAAMIVFGKIDEQIDNFFNAATQVIQQKFAEGSKKLGNSLLNNAISVTTTSPKELIESSGVKTPQVKEDSKALSDYLQSLGIESNGSESFSQLSKKLYQYNQGV